MVLKHPGRASGRGTLCSPYQIQLHVVLKILAIIVLYLRVIVSDDPHADTHSSYGLLEVHGAPFGPDTELNQVPGGQVLSTPSIVVAPSTRQHS